jgi:hypothetical protein
MFFKAIAFLPAYADCTPTRTGGIPFNACIGCWFVRVEKERGILTNMSVFPKLISKPLALQASQTSQISRFTELTLDFVAGPPKAN